MQRDRLLAAFLAGLLLVSAVAGHVSAQETQEEQDPETPEEYVVALNDLRDSEVLAEYPELDLARSQAVVEIQTKESFDERERQRMEHLLNAIVAFDRAHAEAQEDPVESLDHADEAYESLERLEEAGGESYAALGFVALKRFYSVQGERIYEEAQTAESTPEELKLLDAAVHAYERSGDTDQFAEIQIERDELRTQYESDMERHDSLTADAAAFADDCGVSCEGTSALLVASPLSSFAEYTHALRSYEAATRAAAIADRHGVTDESPANTYQSTAFDGLVNAGAASAAIVLAYVLAMLAVAAVVVWRLSAWANDAQRAARDRIVTPLEVDDV